MSAWHRREKLRRSDEKPTSLWFCVAGDAVIKYFKLFLTFFQIHINASSNCEALTVTPGAVGDEDALPDG